MEKEHSRPAARSSSSSSSSSPRSRTGHLGRRLGTLLGMAVLTLAPVAWTPAAHGDDLAAALQTVHRADGHYVAWTDGRQVHLPTPKSAYLGTPTTQGDAWWLATTERHDKTTRLVVWQGHGDAPAQANTLREASSGVLFGPQPIIDEHGLQAALWLEGPITQQTEVRFATWNDDGTWSEPSTLSPAGKGTQTALSVAVLGDGTWLALWTAFDGQDAEVMWSRHQGGEWTSPAAVAADNQVPDITPHVAATDTGAVAAWSRYDGRGDYRVVTARFEPTPAGGAWTPPLQVGDRGTVYPKVVPETSTLLLYRQVVPAAWTLLRLDEAGRPTAKAQWITADKTLPLVRLPDDGHVELQWLDLTDAVEDGDKASAATATDTKVRAEVRQRAVVAWQELPQDLDGADPGNP